MLRFAFLVLAGVVSGRPGRILVIVSCRFLVVGKFVIRKSAQNRMNRRKPLRTGRRRSKGNGRGSTRLVAVLRHILFLDFAQNIQGFLRALAFLERLEINLRKFRFVIQRSHTDGIDRIFKFSFFAVENRDFFRFPIPNISHIWNTLLQEGNNQPFSKLRKRKSMTAPCVRVINAASGRSRMLYGMVDGRTPIQGKIPSYGTLRTFIPVEVFNAVRHSAFDWIIPIYIESMTAAQRHAQTLQRYIVLIRGTFRNSPSHITFFNIPVISICRKFVIVGININADITFPCCVTTVGNLYRVSAGTQDLGVGSGIILRLPIV